MKNKSFTILQQLGKSFMLPIAILPVAGILLGLGSTFTNVTNLENLGALNAMGPGSVFFIIFSLMKTIGSCIFDNLPIIFAVGVAIGTATKDKHTAALAACLAYIVGNMTCGRILIARGMIDEAGNLLTGLADGMITTNLGVNTLQVGVFGGILTGILVAIVHNKYHDIVLPEFLAFFGGNRFIPIVAVFSSMVLWTILTFVWPYIQVAISFLGTLVAKGGVVGYFFFSLIKRLLIPFGLHHVFYLPFWQTAIGGTAVVAGQTYAGAQNILFAQLADPNTAHISRTASVFLMDGYPALMFGIPAACLAIYRNAKKSKKKETKSLMISVALTAFITGITEPFEFPIIFASPIMFVVHALLTGLGAIALYLTNVGVGVTFSTGLIDLLLLGVLPGNAKTGWLAIIPIGILFSVVYYFVFDFAIRKFDLKTPGRESDASIIKINASKEDASDLILNGLGGINNISELDCCATRLRVTVKNPLLISEAELKNTGASGVVIKQNGIQVIYGPRVNVIKDKLEEYMKNTNGSVLLRTPIVGKYIKLEDVPDEAFSTRQVGDGIAIDPTDPIVYAPDDGVVEFVFPTKHAIGFRCDNGLALLIHLGINTVELKGQGFESFVKEGDRVTMGTALIKMDLDFLRKNVKSMASPVLITELPEDKKIEIVADEIIDPNESIIRVVDK